MDMSEKQLEVIVENEKEWRKTIYRELVETRKDLHTFKLEMNIITTTLKVKIGLFGAIFGFIGGGFFTAISLFVK